MNEVITFSTTLISVIIGFLLSILWSEFKKWKENQRKQDVIKKAIGTELQTLLLKLFNCVKHEYCLSREELPFTIKSYEVLRAEAPAFLEPELLLQIDNIYEKFKRLNDIYYLNKLLNFYSFPPR